MSSAIISTVIALPAAVDSTTTADSSELWTRFLAQYDAVLGAIVDGDTCGMEGTDHPEPQPHEPSQNHALTHQQMKSVLVHLIPLCELQADGV